MKAVCLIVIVLFFTGCSLGPNYMPPKASVPINWSNKASISTIEGGAWWRKFNDPTLNELIEQDAVLNLNLQTAQERVKIARSEYAIASARLFPVANLNVLPPNSTGFDLTQLIALTATVDPDLFGRLRQTRQSALASMEAQEAEQHHTLLNLYAEIAVSYMEFREAQAKDKILDQSLSGNKQLLHFLKSRYQAGYLNSINLAQQESLIEIQLSEREQNKALVMALLHKIELLTGNNPGLLAKKLLPPKNIPQLTGAISLGVPSELLRRRPDIIAAERRVAAAHANIRVAMANLMPQINVGWLLGWQTQTVLTNIIASRTLDSSFYGTLNAPILNLGLFRTLERSKQEKIFAVLQYHFTVLHALHEIETQYNYCKYFKSSVSHLQQAVAKKRLVLKLSKSSYQKGSGDFNAVFQIEEDLNHLEMAYLHQLVAYQTAKINLYKALGGGLKEGASNVGK